MRPRRFPVAARALRQPRTRIGLALVLLVLALALIGPLVAPHDPSESVGTPQSGPSGDFLLGTDYLGHDVLSRVLWGGWTVVWMSFAAATLGVALGAAVGLVAGTSRPWADATLMRLMDLLLAFPQIVLVLLFVSMLGSQLWLIVLVVALAWVPQVARVVRGVTAEIAHREYVEWAQASGLPRSHLLLREILPNVTTPLMVEYGLRLTWSIALVAGVSFLGFGIQPPSADWGLMINENRLGLTAQPWPVLIPGLCIAVFAVGANFVAEGIARAVARVEDAR
ncbi:MAG: ABC transporter permease [Actinobacteria bacterium]|nr:ABC transporter permease [Actinomycetota bacterium]